jgi:hypothetical protein
VPPYGPGTQQTNGLAIASLILGIVWITGFGSLIAIVFGYIAKRQIAQSEGRQSGQGLAIAGIVLGVVGLVAVVLWVVLLVVLVHHVNTSYHYDFVNTTTTS